MHYDNLKSKKNNLAVMDDPLIQIIRKTRKDRLEELLKALLENRLKNNSKEMLIIQIYNTWQTLYLLNRFEAI